MAQQTLFQSGQFVVGLLAQTLIVHMIRTPELPFVESRAAAPLMAMTASIMIVGIWLRTAGGDRRAGRESGFVDFVRVD